MFPKASFFHSINEGLPDGRKFCPSEIASKLLHRDFFSKGMFVVGTREQWLANVPSARVCLLNSLAVDLFDLYNLPEFVENRDKLKYRLGYLGRVGNCWLYSDLMFPVNLRKLPQTPPMWLCSSVVLIDELISACVSQQL
jgi:hypothetical protein